MLRLTIFILLLATCLFAQENNKGSISLTFNGEEINLPIKTVLMEKEENIRISARAEINDEEIQQMITLDLTLASLSLENGEPLRGDNFKLDIKTNKLVKYKNGNSSNSKRELLILFSPDSPSLRFSFQEGGEKLTWENLRAISLRLIITDIIFENSYLKISGEFIASLKSGFKSFHMQEVAKIENGKFELIL